MSTVKRVSLIGSTGSIGQNTLDIVQRRPHDLKIVALSSRSDHQRIVAQAEKFKPTVVALFDESAAERAREKLGGTGIKVRAVATRAIEIDLCIGSSSDSWYSNRSPHDATY